MKIVKVRSPFIIEVNEPAQLGSKIELFIWNKGSDEPTTPTYTLSKKISSTSDVKTNYNVSNFVREYINNVVPTISTNPSVEDNNEWCLFKVKRYTLSTVYNLIDTTTYVGVNGFTSHVDGVNAIVDTSGGGSLVPAYPLISNGYKNYRQYNQYNLSSYFNLICQKKPSAALWIFYANTDSGVPFKSAEILPSGTTDEIYNYKIPFRFGSNPRQTIFLSYLGESEFIRVYSDEVEECKYTPVECRFINSKGGWQSITFFKAQTNSISVNTTNYNLSPESVNYNIYKGQSKNFNTNGKQTIKLNTGWVDENTSLAITDLLLSETVSLDYRPVLVKTSSFEIKNSLKEKLINYEIDFEYNFDLINNVL